MQRQKRPMEEVLMTLFVLEPNNKETSNGGFGKLLSLLTQIKCSGKITKINHKHKIDECNQHHI